MDCHSDAWSRRLGEGAWGRTLVGSFQFSSIAKSCLTLVTPWTVALQASLSFTISWSLPKLMSIELVDAIQPSHPLLPSSPHGLNLSQHQDLFQRVGFLQQVAKVLELQL